MPDDTSEVTLMEGAVLWNEKKYIGFMVCSFRHSAWFIAVNMVMFLLCL